MVSNQARTTCTSKVIKQAYEQMIYIFLFTSVQIIHYSTSTQIRFGHISAPQYRITNKFTPSGQYRNKYNPPNCFFISESLKLLYKLLQSADQFTKLNTVFRYSDHRLAGILPNGRML